MRIRASKFFDFLTLHFNRPGYLDDDFERAPNDSTSGGNLGPLAGVGSSGNYMK